MRRPNPTPPRRPNPAPGMPLDFGMDRTRRAPGTPGRPPPKSRGTPPGASRETNPNPPRRANPRPAPNEPNSCHRAGAGRPGTSPEVPGYPDDPRRGPSRADRSQFLSHRTHGIGNDPSPGAWGRAERAPRHPRTRDPTLGDPRSRRRANPSVRLSFTMVRLRAGWARDAGRRAGHEPHDRIAKEHPISS
jgi:hypothetical protein